MSTTPRTDAACFSATTEKPESGDFELCVVDVKVARQLELELAQVTAYNTELVALNDHHAFVRERNDWKGRYESLNHIRCNLDIKLTVARADATALRKELQEVTAAFQAECDHDWEKVDASFDHHFGTKVIRYLQCEKCGKQAEPGDVSYPEEDDEPRIDQRELREIDP